MCNGEAMAKMRTLGSLSVLSCSMTEMSTRVSSVIVINLISRIFWPKQHMGAGKLKRGVPDLEVEVGGWWGLDFLARLEQVE